MATHSSILAWKSEKGEWKSWIKLNIQLKLDILECELSGPSEALLQTKLVEVMELQLSYLKP